jgi:phosphatidylethanolamine-binding protein (PEBP) family uncharacterized protein
MKTFKITSPAFAYGDSIPVKFTCDGDDVSPELEWVGIPENTKSLALICDDPDAPLGTWVHWVIFNIPPEINHFNEKYTPSKGLSGGLKREEGPSTASMISDTMDITARVLRKGRRIVTFLSFTRLIPFLI